MLFDKFIDRPFSQQIFWLPDKSIWVFLKIHFWILGRNFSTQGYFWLKISFIMQSKCKLQTRFGGNVFEMAVIYTYSIHKYTFTQKDRATSLHRARLSEWSLKFFCLHSFSSFNCGNLQNKLNVFFPLHLHLQYSTSDFSLETHCCQVINFKMT